MFMINPHSGRAGKLSDEDLVGKYRRARRAADFDALFGRYAPMLGRLCHHYLHDPEDSRDVVMQVFEKCLRSFPGPEISSFRAWLFAMARNECIDFLRRSRRAERRKATFALLTAGPAAAGSYRRSSTPRLHRALGQLSEEQRRCIELFYYEGQSYRDIAHTTRQSVGAVKSNIQNGRRRLRLLMEA